VAAKKPDTPLRVRAMQYLARREYSRAELHEKLLPFVQEGDDLEAELDALAQRGWLSDARAADQLVNQRRGRFGTQRIAHEMRQKGLSEDLIGAALPALKQGELEAAREVWQKKFGILPDNAKEKARQMRFLQQRGFSADVIFQVMKFSDTDE
jgi:regulatory protein